MLVSLRPEVSEAHPPSLCLDSEDAYWMGADSDFAHRTC